MNLPNLKELDKVIALCRKRGVAKITLGDITLELGEAPRKRLPDISPEMTGDIELTPEELLFFSAGGMPPELKD